MIFVSTFDFFYNDHLMTPASLNGVAESAPESFPSCRCPYDEHHESKNTPPVRRPRKSVQLVETILFDKQI